MTIKREGPQASVFKCLFGRTDQARANGQGLRGLRGLRAKG